MKRYRAALGVAVLALAATCAAAQEATLGASLSLDYDYRYRSSDELVETSKIKSGIDLLRNYFDLPPFAEFQLYAKGDNGLGAAIGGMFRRELLSIGYFSDTNLPVNGSAGYSVAFERPFLSLGALWWRSDWLSIELGRDKSDYGEDLEGSLYPSGRLPYLDALKTRCSMGPIAIDWMVASLHAVRSWEAAKYGDPSYDVEPNAGLSSDYVSDEEPYGFYDDENPTIVLDALHRFSWNFGALELGLGANVIYARRNNYFLITDFLPVSSWHQTQILSNNLTLYLDATLKPMDGLTIAAEAGYDDINVSIFGLPDTTIPTIDAYVLGARYAGPTRAGRLSAYLEAGYTHYLWGNYDGSSDEPGDEDPLARAQYRFLVVNGAALLPLTSPYGPGAIWGRAEASLGIVGTALEAGVELLVLSKNTEANLIDTPYDTSAADGARLLFVSLSTPLSYRFRALTLYAAPTFCSRDATIWFECSVGIGIDIRGERRVAGTRESPLRE